MTGCINYSKWDQLDDDGDFAPLHRSPQAGTIRDPGWQQARPKLTKQDQRDAAQYLLLRGASSAAGLHAMGVYVMQSDTLVNGRPYFQRENDRSKCPCCDYARDNMIWASGSGLLWQLGAPHDLGTTRCLLSLRDDGGALLPERATGVWSAWTNGAWVEEASISCVTLAAAVAELKPTSVCLVGGIPVGRTCRLNLQGTYHLGSEYVNGRPTYCHVQGAVRMWWVDGYWTVGHALDFGSQASLAWCAGEELLPELAAPCWVVVGESQDDGLVEAP
eukprot:4428669-Prymnesium_polylepis.1